MLYLLDKGREALGRASERRRVLADWDTAIDSLGAREGRFRVWRDESGARLTNFPPPLDFRGFEDRHFGHPGYCRSLTDSEEEAAEARDERRQAEACAARERFFALPAADP